MEKCEKIEKLTHYYRQFCDVRRKKMKYFIVLFFVHLAPFGGAKSDGNLTDSSETAEKSLARKKFNVKILQDSDEKDNKSYLNRYKKENYLPENIVSTKKNFTTWSYTSDDAVQQKEFPQAAAGNYYKYQVVDKNRSFIRPTIRPPSARPTRVNVIFLPSSSTLPPPSENAITKPIIQLPDFDGPTPFSPSYSAPPPSHIEKVDQHMELLKQYFRFNCTLTPKSPDLVDDKIETLEGPKVTHLQEETVKQAETSTEKAFVKDPVILTTEKPPMTKVHKKPLKKPSFPALDTLSISESDISSEADDDDYDETDESDFDFSESEESLLKHRGPPHHFESDYDHYEEVNFAERYV